MHMKLSLVVPCYNEEENVAAFQQAVIAAFQGCGYSYEIIFVDDGSSDGTLTQLEALYRSQACPVSVVRKPDCMPACAMPRGHISA